MVKILKLKELSDYQKGVISSKTLIGKDSGTVTYFAFDKGEGLSEHKTPFDAIVIIIDGKARITIQDKAFDLEALESIIMPANETHKVFATERFKMLLIMLKS